MTPPHQSEGIYTYDSIMKPPNTERREDLMETRNAME
jgi:hypothetical protein